PAGRAPSHRRDRAGAATGRRYSAGRPLGDLGRARAGRARHGARLLDGRARREGALEDLPRRLRRRAVHSDRQGANRHLAQSRAEAPRGDELRGRRLRARSARRARRRPLRDRQPRQRRRRQRRPGHECGARHRRAGRTLLRGSAPVTLRAVVKAGGSAGVDRDAVADLVADVARSDEIVLVHGASAETNKLAEALGHAQETITSPSGHSSRRTDRRTLEIFAMAALGVENFLYVEKLQQRGIDAVGLSGLSGRLLVARKKDVRSVLGSKTVLLRDDYTGKVEAVNLPLLTQFIGPGRVPVVAPLALSTENEALNVDGDRVAAAIAVAIDADALIILTSVPGLLRDPKDPTSLVAETTLGEAEALAQGRMKVK